MAISGFQDYMNALRSCMQHCKSNLPEDVAPRSIFGSLPASVIFDQKNLSGLQEILLRGRVPVRAAPGQRYHHNYHQIALLAHASVCQPPLPKNKKAPENQGLNRISLPAFAGLCRLGNHSHSIMGCDAKPLKDQDLFQTSPAYTIKNTIHQKGL